MLLSVFFALMVGFRTIVLKTAQKRPFLDTKLAVERARRLEMQRNLFVVMRLCSPVVLSHRVFARTFGPPIAAACCYCCCLLKCVAHPWTLKSGVKPRQGKPSSVNTIKTRTRTELGPSLA